MGRRMAGGMRWVLRWWNRETWILGMRVEYRVAFGAGKSEIDAAAGLCCIILQELYNRSYGRTS